MRGPHLGDFLRRNNVRMPGHRRALAAAPFAFLSARRAQRNSLARMAMPATTIGNPGPGSTKSAMPTNSTVPPANATIIFFIV